MDKGKSSIGLVVAGLLLGLFMSSLDQTIVSTAMPTIIKKLGGMESFIWVYSAYMIAMVVATPIFGKLSDMYGRKRFFLAGLVVFLLGSILCGMATNMDQLILYRALQGIGGGAIMPIAFTIIFDTFPAEKRGKMMGLFGAVFGLSSVFGPILGGAITDYMSWRWIFYINVPIGILAIYFIMRGYRESKVTEKQTIDWAGAVLLVGWILPLMFGLELGGTDGWAWDSSKTISLFAGAAVLLALFLFVETKAKDPIIKLGLFKSSLFTGSMGIGLLYGGVMMASATYIPIFIQGVFHLSATETSTVLMPMMLGVVLSAQLGGRFGIKFRYRDVLLLSALTLTAGSVMLGFVMDPSTSRALITLFMIIIGLGIGVSFSLLNISTLSSVPPQYKGSASSLIAFFRTIGSALGIAVFGSMQKQHFQSGIQDVEGVQHLPAEVIDGIKGGQTLLNPEFQQALPAGMVEQLLVKLSDSILFVFQWSVALPVLAFIFVFMLGRARMEISRPGVPGGQTSHGPHHAGGGQGKPEPTFDRG